MSKVFISMDKQTADKLWVALSEIEAGSVPAWNETEWVQPIQQQLTKQGIDGLGE